jgi:branched-chain amino acid transport system permease protein
MDLQFLLQTGITGIASGAVYALIALGFTVTYNASRVANFAQGQFVVLGGLIAITLVEAGAPLPVGAAASVLAVALIAGVVYVATVGRVPEGDPFRRIMVTLGIALAAEAALQVVWGTQARRLPPFSGDQPLNVLGAAIAPQTLWVIAGAIVVMIALNWFFRSTRTGQAMLAVSEHREGAGLLGIQVARMSLVAFVLGAGLAAVAGVMVSPISSTVYFQGLPLTVAAFAAAVVGGFGNPVGAVVGGLALGLLQAFSIAWLPSGVSDAAPFAALIAFLVLRPRGLVGSRVLT